MGRRAEHLLDGFGALEADETESPRSARRVSHHYAVRGDAEEGFEVAAQVVRRDVFGQGADENFVIRRWTGESAIGRRGNRS